MLKHLYRTQDFKNQSTSSRLFLKFKNLQLQLKKEFFLFQLTVHTPSNIPGQSPFVKFHLHNSNSSHQSCNYSTNKSQTTPNGLQRQPISMAENPTMQTNSGNSKRKRSWSRAVFSQLQRKGLEIQFQIQKYITKPDRRKLAARLGLTDAQVNSLNYYKHRNCSKFIF